MLGLKKSLLLSCVFVLVISFFFSSLSQAQTAEFSSNFKGALNYVIDTKSIIPYAGFQTKYVLDFFELSGSVGVYLIVPMVSLDAHLFYPIPLSDDTQMRPYVGGGVSAWMYNGIGYEAHATLGLEFIKDDIGYFIEAKPTINLSAPENSILQLSAGFNIYPLPARKN